MKLFSLNVYPSRASLLLINKSENPLLVNIFCYEIKSNKTACRWIPSGASRPLWMYFTANVHMYLFDTISVNLFEQNMHVHTCTHSALTRQWIFFILNLLAGRRNQNWKGWSNLGERNKTYLTQNGGSKLLPEMPIFCLRSLITMHYQFSYTSNLLKTTSKL